MRKNLGVIGNYGTRGIAVPRNVQFFRVFRVFRGFSKVSPSQRAPHGNGNEGKFCLAQSPREVG